MARALYTFYARDEALSVYLSPGADDVQRAWEESSVNRAGGLRISDLTSQTAGIPDAMRAVIAATPPGPTGRYPDCVRVTRLSEGFTQVVVAEIRAVALSPDLPPSGQVQWAQVVANEFEMHLEDKLRTVGSEFFSTVCDLNSPEGAVVRAVTPGAQLACDLGAGGIGASFSGGVRYRLYNPEDDASFIDLLNGAFCRSRTRHEMPGFFDKPEHPSRYTPPEKNWTAIAAVAGAGVLVTGGLVYLAYKFAPSGSAPQRFSAPSVPSAPARSQPPQTPAPRPAPTRETTYVPLADRGEAPSGRREAAEPRRPGYETRRYGL